MKRCGTVPEQLFFKYFRLRNSDLQYILVEAIHLRLEIPIINVYDLVKAFHFLLAGKKIVS